MEATSPKAPSWIFIKFSGILKLKAQDEKKFEKRNEL